MFLGIHFAADEEFTLRAVGVSKGEQPTSYHGGLIRSWQPRNNMLRTSLTVPHVKRAWISERLKVDLLITIDA
jgi:hypothetical protein